MRNIIPLKISVDVSDIIFAIVRNGQYFVVAVSFYMIEEKFQSNVIDVRNIQRRENKTGVILFREQDCTLQKNSVKKFFFLRPEGAHRRMTRVRRRRKLNKLEPRNYSEFCSGGKLRGLLVALSSSGSGVATPCAPSYTTQ